MTSRGTLSSRRQRLHPVGAIAGRHRRERLAVGGVDRVEAALVDRVDKLSANEQPGFRVSQFALGNGVPFCRGIIA